MPFDGVRDLFTETDTFPAKLRVLFIVNLLKPSASVPPEATVTAPEIVPLPPKVPPELTATEPVPVPLPLVLLMSSVPALLVVSPE